MIEHGTLVEEGVLCMWRRQWSRQARSRCSEEHAISKLYESKRDISELKSANEGERNREGVITAPCGPPVGDSARACTGTGARQACKNEKSVF